MSGPAFRSRHTAVLLATVLGVGCGQAPDEEPGGISEAAPVQGAPVEGVQRTVVFREAPRLPALVRYRHADRPGRWCLAIPHENEKTAFEVAVAFIAEHGGTLIRVEQKGTRNVSFEHSGHRVVVDPNRIATPAGLRMTIEKLNPAPARAAPADLLSRVDRFGRRFVELIDRCLGDPDIELIVTLHNNRDSELANDYGIRSYTVSGSAGGDVDRSVAENPTIHEHQDTDNFFVVTDRRDFERLRSGWNVVLVSREASDDGSLSVYYQQKRYVNVEAQHGAADVQAAMLRAAVTTLDSKRSRP